MCMCHICVLILLHATCVLILLCVCLHIPLQVAHMGAMVKTYRRFVEVSRARSSSSSAPRAPQSYGHDSGAADPPDEPDKDVEILDKWIAEVTTWMREEGHAVP
jgi:hypothetical protein